MSGGRGEVRWNAATQKWEPVTAAPEAAPPPAAPPSSTPPSATPPPVAPPPLPPRPPGDAFAPDGYAPGPLTEPLPPPGPGRVEPGRPRRVPLAVVIAMVVVAVAGAGGGYLLARGGHGGPKVTPTTSASGSTSDIPGRDGGVKGGPSASASPSPSATTPAGYRLAQDPQGFRLYVPQDWTRDDQGTKGVFYNSADHKRLIQVYRVGGADLRPYDALKQTSGELARQHPDYQEISLADDATVPGIAGPVARLVYAYNNQELGHRRQVVDYAFLTPGGTHYAILSAAPDDAWPEQETTLKTALSVFCADSNCPSMPPG
ncbi:hypothetical protein ACFYN0_24175 [Streptomyces sp. NPDC006704]|uniref:hypothetical protein n=1 Tax=Streptomyces sp. NPDC006704 TaxID=3364760 RepID=UPI003674118D